MDPFGGPFWIQKETKKEALIFLHLHEHQKWLCLWTTEKPANRSIHPSILKEKCAFRLDESTPARVPSRRNAYFFGYIDRCLTYLAHFCPLQTCSGTCSEPQNGPFWVFIGAQKATTSCPKRSCTHCLLHTCNFLKTPSTTLVSIIMHSRMRSKKAFPRQLLDIGRRDWCTKGTVAGLVRRAIGRSVQFFVYTFSLPVQLEIRRP